MQVIRTGSKKKERRKKKKPRGINTRPRHKVRVSLQIFLSHHDHHCQQRLRVQRAAADCVRKPQLTATVRATRGAEGVRAQMTANDEWLARGGRNSVRVGSTGDGGGGGVSGLLMFGLSTVMILQHEANEELIMFLSLLLPYDLRYHLQVALR